MTVPPPVAAARWVRVTVGSRDAHRLVTWLAAGGLAAAGVLAAVGLPPVDVHGPLHLAGVMDPLCGGTRAVRYAALGQWGLSWRYNPLGVPLALGAVLVVGRAGVGLARGRWLNVAVVWTPARVRAVIAFLVVVLASLQVRQQLLADLLTAH